MNIHIQLAQFLEGLEEQRKAILSYLPVNGYKTTQELFSACAEWIDLEHGPWVANGYKEYFLNIVANLKHENSSHLALAVFIKTNPCSDVQLFLLLRLLTKTATDACAWDNRMETYLDRGQAIFTQEELDTLFKEPQETYQIGNICQYNKRSIYLNRQLVHVKQFLGVLPKSN
ncbi:MAG: hypothetical protein ACI351_06980 [Candidatus Avelusimicrobium sp.]|uniref:hypothetical protein n=1 Tax=Candidatus Avelusimicrobium sp. TaxID=3048833 RepID=UPI003F044A78